MDRAGVELLREDPKPVVDALAEVVRAEQRGIEGETVELGLVSSSLVDKASYLLASLDKLDRICHNNTICS